jgi:DNA-binding NtrC family response regulator
METANASPANRGIFSMTSGKSPHPAHLLVVDDETLIRWSLSERLTEAGYTVSEAGDVADAMRIITAGGAIDLAVLDYRLPDGNGVALLKTIKDRCPSCPVIMMTAFGSPEMTEEAFSQGAFAIVSKPFQLDDVSRLVDQALTAH